MRVVVNEAWGNDDDGVCGSDRSPGCVPTVLEEDCNPQGDHSRQSTETLKKKRGNVVRVQGRMDWSGYETAIQSSVRDYRVIGSRHQIHLRITR